MLSRISLYNVANETLFSMSHIFKKLLEHLQYYKSGKKMQPKSTRSMDSILPVYMLIASARIFWNLPYRMTDQRPLKQALENAHL